MNYSEVHVSVQDKIPSSDIKAISSLISFKRFLVTSCSLYFQNNNNLLFSQETRDRALSCQMTVTQLRDWLQTPAAPFISHLKPPQLKHGQQHHPVVAARYYSQI